MSYFWKEQLPSINWHKHSQYKPNGILKRLSPSWGMNAVLLTDLTWTRIFSQLSFLSDKHLPSPLGSGYLISRLIYSQCGIYLNQWTLPRAIQKPRWDYYQHKVLVDCQNAMEIHFLSMFRPQISDSPAAKTLRMSSVSASHTISHFSPAQQNLFHRRGFVNNNLNLRFHFSERRHPQRFL